MHQIRYKYEYKELALNTEDYNYESLTEYGQAGWRVLESWSREGYPLSRRIYLMERVSVLGEEREEVTS